MSEPKTKRGRGQRRSRRLKNVSLERAQQLAREHLTRNPPLWGYYSRATHQAHLATVTDYYRSAYQFGAKS